MKEVRGRGVSGGIAIGEAYIYRKEETGVRREAVADIQKELRRFEAARETALAQLEEIRRKALEKAGEQNAAVFEAHKLMLEDEGYLGSVRDIIREQRLNAEYAVDFTGDSFAHMFEQMDDAYLRERAADVRDITERLIRALSGDAAQGPDLAGPVILMAEDLTPSETVQLDKTKLLGLVTRQGSASSHTAILARAMNIPALAGVDIREEWQGKTAVVDGDAGVLFLDPDPETLGRMAARQRGDEERQRLLRELKDSETVTRGGQRLSLYANVGNVEDVAAALENGAEGIGLFRSEFLYLGSADFPTEEQQFAAYRAAAAAMEGKRVIIRTLDIGADKQADYFGLEKEENPAMGYRAIRICLERPGLLKTQLRAILRAGAYGRVAVMFPMIISVEEVRRCLELLQEAKRELAAQDIPFGEVETGIMIETPAAVWISGELAKEVDFFSIGTNDLTQYTLAIDRQNPRLDRSYDPHHPAVLRAIETTVENGHKNGIWVGICGELAADTSLTEAFVRMGVDELSVSPAFVLPVREAVRKLP